MEDVQLTRLEFLPILGLFECWPYAALFQASTEVGSLLGEAILYGPQQPVRAQPRHRGFMRPAQIAKTVQRLRNKLRNKRQFQMFCFLNLEWVIHVAIRNTGRSPVRLAYSQLQPILCWPLRFQKCRQPKPVRTETCFDTVFRR